MTYLILVLLAAATRLMPHPANVAPIGGLALFAGATGLTMKSRWQRVGAYLVPLLALLFSDAFIGFYTWQIMLSVYVSFAIVIGLGLLVRRYYSWSTIIAASLAGSIIFFLVTNAAVWAFTPMYTKTLAGLMQSYVAALPFFRNSVLSDLVYTGVLFGAYELARRTSRQERAILASSH